MSNRRRVLRDHPPVVIEDFNGLWNRGGDEAVPIDHFAQARNIQYGESNFTTRDGLDVDVPGVQNIVRMYNYKLQDGESLIILDSSGNFYHALYDGTDTVYGPILTIAGADDFGFHAVAGRAYITPFETNPDSDGVNKSNGISGEFVYVYKGDGTAARKAAGNPPTGAAMGVAAGTGNSDLGFHLFAVVYETDTGYLTALGPGTFTGYTSVSTTAGYAISGVPVSPDSFVVARHIVMTKAILNYNGDQDGYQFFFAPDGKINDNTTTTINISAFDIDLLDDASHLIDNFSEIPACVGLTNYNNRMVLSCFSGDDISLVRLSAPGEPEAIDQVDGNIIVPLDGNPVTIAQEYRDVLYLFKFNRTYASVDNLDVPSTWAGPQVVDNGIGSPVHGIATVLDSGGVNIESLIIADCSGLMVFNGRYARPELSFKIQDLWLGLDANLFHRLQLVNNTVEQFYFCVLPDWTLLFWDYARGLDPKNVRFATWDFDIQVNTVAIAEKHVLKIGSAGTL